MAAAVVVAATLIILAPSTRPPQVGARLDDDDIYDEIASGPAD